MALTRETARHSEGKQRLSAPSISFSRQRVQDTAFPRNEILVRDDKGAQDWITTLPESRHAPLRAQLKMDKRFSNKTWKTAMTFEPFRSCWVIATLRP